MGFAEIFGVDGAKVFSQSAFDGSLVDEVSDGAEQVMLGLHVFRLEHGPCVHELPVYRDGFEFKGHDVKARRVVDEAEFSLRFDELLNFW